MSGNIRVIIAEDHAVVREGTRELIEREPDIEVVGEATNGAEAVALVERLAPDIAIVVSISLRLLLEGDRISLHIFTSSSLRGITYGPQKGRDPGVKSSEAKSH